ncbi:MAG TPA: hypothetical protein VL027_07500 [Spongiibacteraceae bacterium]|jgi:hypothetical protein|nr:hypothetical protein [Spongiibacteraceae bacterium]HUH37773.1 hypothetical protein [Spongiibacteraceae bacterium]
MSQVDNVVRIDEFRNAGQQAIVDDISARTFLFLRDEAESCGVRIKDVIAEHMLGLALVVEAVEGTASSRDLLNQVIQRLRG